MKRQAQYDSDPIVTAHPERLDLGPFRILRRIGSGGMGLVFLAQDRRWAGVNALVALKRIHPHLLDDEQFVEMFFDEAAIASRISHPNVARVFDYGTLAGAPFLTMELLQGHGLSNVRKALASKRCPLDAKARLGLIVRIIADAAEGLHAAHELHDADGNSLNVVHRDVSPQNIFVTHDGISKVVDFGAVKAEQQRHRTRTGFFKGKCSYIAPDNLLGKPIDRRVDVWSLGVVLWELLTGKRLFMRDTAAQSLRAVLDGDIPAPSDIAPGLPRPISNVAVKALQREPSERHANMRELASELESALATVLPSSASHVTAGVWLDSLFPGERERAKEEIARHLEREHDEDVEESTMLWLDCEEDQPLAALLERLERDAPKTLAKQADDEPATRVARREQTPATPSVPPTANSIAPAPLPVASNPWKTATWCILASVAGLILGTSFTGSASATAVTPHQPATQPAATPEPAPVRQVAPPPAPGLEVWTSDADGERRLIWRGTPAAFGSAQAGIADRYRLDFARKEQLESPGSKPMAMHREPPAESTNDQNESDANESREREKTERSSRWPNDI